MGRDGRLGLVTAPTLYRGSTPPNAIHNHAAVAPTGGTRTSAAHRQDLNGTVLQLYSVAANHIRSGCVKDPTTGLYLPGVLLEPERENLWVHNTDIENQWATTGGSLSAAPATLAGIGAARLTEDGTTTFHRTFSGTGMSFTAAQQYTVSFLVSAVGRDVAAIAFSNNGTNTWANWLLSTNTVGYSSGFDAVAIHNMGTCSLCLGTWTHAATEGRDPGIHARDGNNNSYPITDTYAGSSAAALDVTAAQIETGAFPSSLIETAAAAVTRTADSAVVYTLGSEMAKREWTLLAPVLIPEHTPASDLKLLSVYKNGAAATDHVTLWADTSGYAKATSAASGGDAGEAVTSTIISDGDIHWVSIHVKHGQLYINVDNDKDVVVDNTASIAADLDRCSIEPSGAWVGGIGMVPQFIRAQGQGLLRMVKAQLLKV